MPIFAIANEKGGVGKTTTAVTLGAGFSQRGYRTLIIDLDSQGNVADSLGLEAGGDLYQLLLPGSGKTLSSATISSRRSNLDIIRSNRLTSTLKIILSGMDFRERVLAGALENHDYDVVLLDCAPSLDVLHTAVLVAADYLLIPTRLDQLSIKGVRDTLTTLASIRKASPACRCDLMGIIPTFYGRLTKESLDQLVLLAGAFKNIILPPVPQDTKCRVATRQSQTLWEFDPQCRALTDMDEVNGKRAGGYLQILDCLIARLK